MDKKGIRWKQKKGGGMDVFEINPKDVFFKDFEHSRKKKSILQVNRMILQWRREGKTQVGQWGKACSGHWDILSLLSLTKQLFEISHTLIFSPG